MPVIHLNDIEKQVKMLDKKVKNYSPKMLLVDIKISEDNFNDFVRRGEESVEKAVETGRVRVRVVGAAECATFLAVR